MPAGLTTDLDGNPRFVDDPLTPDTGNPGAAGPPIVDMGPYEFQPPPFCVAPDFDCDNDVDDDDVAHLAACATGPDIPLNFLPCGNALLDADNDIDQLDFAILQRCYSGQNIPPEPNCAE